MPKEMMPVVSKPLIEYGVEEALAAGLADICMVTGRGKRALENHFDANLAIIGRYILTPDIFDLIRDTEPGKGGEIQITDALMMQAQGGCVLVYNLIRALMGKTAEHIGKTPRETSFKASQETLVSFHQTLLGAAGDWLEEKIANMLEIIGQHVVGNRPGRSEPRAVKRRPKPHKRLQHPRARARRLKKYQGKAA